MEPFIISICESYGISYYKLPNAQSINNIYNLLKNNIKGSIYDKNELIYYGFYYQEIKKNKQKMIKYYMDAIKYGNVQAANYVIIIFLLMVITLI